MNSLRQFLICAILFSAILAVYSLDNDSVNTKGELEAGKQDVTQSSASEMARRRRHRFGQHLCKRVLKANFSSGALSESPLKVSYFRFNSECS